MNKSEGENHACNLLGSLVSLVWKKRLLNSNTQILPGQFPTHLQISSTACQKTLIATKQLRFLHWQLLNHRKYHKYPPALNISKGCCWCKEYWREDTGTYIVLALNDVAQLCATCFTVALPFQIGTPSIIFLTLWALLCAGCRMRPFTLPQRLQPQLG